MRTRFIAPVLACGLIATGCAAVRQQETAGAGMDKKVIASDIKSDDQAITSAIRSRFAQVKDPAMKGIAVETLYGVVLLSGAAGSPQQKRAAHTIAAQVEGVRAVHNALVVRP